MPRRTKPKYQLPRRRRKKGRGAGLLSLAIPALIVVVAFWFWHRNEQSPKQIPSPTPARTPASTPPPAASSATAPAQLPPTAPAAAKPQVQPPTLPGPPPADVPRPARDVVLEAQIALARRGISPGVIDAAIGSQTRAAISVFQETQHLPQTGRLDADTRARLTLDAPMLTNYLVTTNDLAQLQPLGKTWLAKSQQSALAYETELELVAEKSHSNPLLILKLNPNVTWTNITAGTVLKIPDVKYPEPANRAAFVIIHLSQKFLEAFDDNTNLLAHFPCSIAAKVEKRPVGELHVIVLAPNPNYTVNPDLFPESAELQALGHKLILLPGPNNPVGVAWIGLDRPGYGIHGTPVPELVGRTESHGCFRLANWDAEYLIKLVWVGMPVFVEP
ncbi:MAG TPA: L,D-transpeptidase family protein [Verrucomicrobiae bacterium]|nr:L,D-transpeptidase family protein [Verrucomicrobiae bacterium]